MRIFFATIIVALSCLAFFNGWANVAGLGEEEIYALAKAQERQEALVSDGEFDQRAWVKGRLERSCPDTLVLGSSTLGAINTASVGQGELLNAWLTGPMVQDLQGVAHLLKVQILKQH